MADQSRVMNYRPIHYCQQFQRYWRELRVTEYTIIHKFIKRKKENNGVCIPGNRTSRKKIWVKEN